MKSLRDHMGHLVSVPAEPLRIISLVPSQTALLNHLHLDKEIIGITRFCTVPRSWTTTKTVVGGTKQLDVERIKRLSPNLIIGNKEENDQAQINALKACFPVWMSDIRRLPDALDMISSIGILTDRAEQARRLVESIEKAFLTCPVVKVPKSALYLIWRKPWMAVASETFIHDMLCRIGLVNVLGSQQRYPLLTDNMIAELKPDLIFLPSEPFPFRQKHVEEVGQICPGAKILCVDGEWFSWYGSHLLKAVDYFASLPLEGG